MKTLVLLTLLACMAGGSLGDVDFDRGWRFRLEGRDSEWREVNVPHDWSVEGVYDETANGTNYRTGYLPAGTGLYEKDFEYDSAWDGKEVSVLFDGVYMLSTVWINGHELGTRPHGYIGFEYDLTGYLKEGKNTLAVKVDNSRAQSSRWYTGCGIYRNVTLRVKDSVHIPLWGVRFDNGTASVDICNGSSEGRRVKVLGTLMDGKRKVSRKSISVEVSSQDTADVVMNLLPRNVRVWSPEDPHLYTLEMEVRDGHNRMLDAQKLRVGFRTISYDASEGFKLNGSPLKLKGVCDHHTLPTLGAAVPRDIWVYRIGLLKRMGCNAIRTAHTPFAPEFYDICDSLGMMVLDEAFDSWNKSKTPDDYGRFFMEWWRRDLGDFVRRDRSHPCVVAWSIGNEVRGMDSSIQQQMVEFVHSLDSSRPVTQGGTDPTRGQKSNVSKYLDIIGFNGNGEEIGELETFHDKYPDVCGIGTEMPHTYQTRGVYRSKTAWRGRDFLAPWSTEFEADWDTKWANKVFPVPDLSAEEVFPEEDCPWYLSSYDNATVRISARECWRRVEERPWMLGMFRWTGFDYPGEAVWPQRFKSSGVVDAAGLPKDHYYLYQSLWSGEPMVHILPHWTHWGKEGRCIPVVAYTNSSAVELYLNGRSLGRQEYSGDQLVWQVPWESGTLRAVAYGWSEDGNPGDEVVAEDSVTTCQRMSPNVDLLHPESLWWEKGGDRSLAFKMLYKGEVSLVEVDVVDSRGVVDPYGKALISWADLSRSSSWKEFVSSAFPVPAERIVCRAIENGDPIDLTQCLSTSRCTFRGRAVLILSFRH